MNDLQTVTMLSEKRSLQSEYFYSLVELIKKQDKHYHGLPEPIEPETSHNRFRVLVADAKSEEYLVQRVGQATPDSFHWVSANKPLKVGTAVSGLLLQEGVEGTPASLMVVA
ncbi:hypothetical protein SD81_017205 [Tolypothrix campylonemoides VB511288]|nr:hypothetical protein SD81_017205 [Tolypothrix campylonemoides VB511288]